MKRIDLHVWGPLIALIGLFILGALLNPAFLAPANLSNVLARSAFIGLIAIGMTTIMIAVNRIEIPTDKVSSSFLARQAAAAAIAADTPLTDISAETVMFSSLDSILTTFWPNQ